MIADTADHVDLHCHTLASDGTLTPAELIDRAFGAGLVGVAITDHDTIAGVAEGAAAATGRLVFVPGVELTSDHLGSEVHILGYHLDVDHRPLLDYLAWARDRRLDRIERMCAALRSLGLDLSLAEVQAVARGGSIGRPHIAYLMIDKGMVASVGEAFDRYLGRGRPGFVPRERVDAETAITIIRDAGGVPVLAHPLSIDGALDHLPALIAMGLMGLEAYYGEYSPAQRQRLADLARAHGLVATGGSDFHGDGFKPGRTLGSGDVPASVLDELAARAAARVTHRRSDPPMGPA